MTGRRSQAVVVHANTGVPARTLDVDQVVDELQPSERILGGARARLTPERRSSQVKIVSSWTRW
jgi:hypothetical protein